MSYSTKKLLVEKHGKVLVIKINNPKRKNAIGGEIYKELPEIFSDAANDESVTVVVLTGVGDFYSSGNDFGDTMQQAGPPEDNSERLKKFIRLFFNFPKVLIAVVNGPAIGVAATTAALCDVIYCSETAYFLTPFTRFGLVAEGCSTFTFPRILGRSKAREMLLLNHKLTAEEALRFNFVSEIYKPEEFQSKIWPKIVEYSELMPDTVKRCKSILMKFENDLLEKHLEIEVKKLEESFQSDDFAIGMVKFMNRKAKL